MVDRIMQGHSIAPLAVALASCLGALPAQAAPVEIAWDGKGGFSHTASIPPHV